MSERADAVVIGAGVIGLAVARALALRGREVVIVEREGLIGSGTSSRNSEVIHAGIYYPTGSLKARSCVDGKQRLYAFLESHGVPYRRCGKLIVASEAAQTEGLAALKRQAAENGVEDLRWLSAADIRALEPEVHGVAGLLSPSTGILDSHACMLALQGDAEAAGAMIAFATPVAALAATDEGPEIETGGANPMRLRCATLVNAGGLEAVPLARRCRGLDPAILPRHRFAKGNYYVLAGRAPFSHLVYPMPEPGGLGVHVTIDMGGEARFGPDVEWLETLDPAELDYSVHPARAERFYAAVRHYWPGLADHGLLPGYAGIRPKLSGPGEPAADFRIDGPAAHGRPGLINLFGIESPGLTAALSLAELVADIAGPRA